MKITLIGFMGAGKTTIGKELAEKLNVPFIDIDKEIEKNLSLPIPEIFEKLGETFFRKTEIETFKAITTRFNNVIVSSGGGMPAFDKNMEILKENSVTIYLKADFETLWSRIKNDSNRPLVKLGKDRVKELFEKRKPFYKRAHMTIDTTGKTPLEIIETIEKKLKEIRKT
ncbi:shikimate kinase [Desulfurobacterium sp.]